MNIIILIETQRSLQQLCLPAIDGSKHLNLADFIGRDVVTSAFEEVTLTLTESTGFDDRLATIARLSSQLRCLHLHFSYQNGEGPNRILSGISRGPPSRQTLLSMATRISMRGYDFTELFTRSNRLFFPCLRAFALVDCHF